MAWNYENSLIRVKAKYEEVADVEVTRLSREVDFQNIGLLKPRLVHGAHVYVDVPNFTSLELIQDWIGKVDTKANIALVVQIAVAGGLIAASQTNQPLGQLIGPPLTYYRTGVALIILALVLAISVAVPSLRRRAARREAAGNTIYFGHLRRWRPEDLAGHLTRQTSDEELQELCRQVVITARICWWKHIRIGWSILAATAGAAAIITSALLP